MCQGSEYDVHDYNNIIIIASNVAVFVLWSA